MSIFSSIMDKIFHAAGSAASAVEAAPANAAPTGTPASPDASAPAASSGPPVDVGAVLAEMAAKRGQPSNYKTSIVDLMTLLGLDSSLNARKELAKELGYTGSTDDSYTMNVWLHKQVMAKLEQNGGKVPDDLKAA